jgi:hypothetical protein
MIQGRHRCILEETVADRPEDEGLEDVIWTARAELADFQPVVGPNKVSQETLSTPDELTHVFEEVTYKRVYPGASEFQKMQMDRFMM